MQKALFDSGQRHGAGKWSTECLQSLTRGRYSDGDHSQKDL